MTFRILPESLHSTANFVLEYFSKERGLRCEIEVAVDPSIEYRPTSVAQTRDFHIVSIDISENIYNPTRLYFITECEKKCLPVRFYVALPTVEYSKFSEDLKFAKKAGIGVIEVNLGTKVCTELLCPLSLSLTGLRDFDKTAFPKKYRENIDHAESTFKNGEPNKACSIVYDEIEALTRRIAIKAHKDGMLQIKNPSDLKEKMPWSSLIILLRDKLNRENPKYSPINATLVSRILGTTTHRNASGHKVNSRKAIVTRDKQLRTRMESAVDLLSEIVEASKNLHV